MKKHVISNNKKSSFTEIFPEVSTRQGVLIIRLEHTTNLFPNVTGSNRQVIFMNPSSDMQNVSIRLVHKTRIFQNVTRSNRQVTFMNSTSDIYRYNVH